MPRYFFLPLFLFFIVESTVSYSTHIRGGYIEVSTDPASLVCQVKLNLYTDMGSTVQPGGGEMDFGDGSAPVRLNPGNPDEFYQLDNDMALIIFHESHAFPGPGTYKISYRESNRNGGIINLPNAVNTPFCIETMIVTDPFFGNNSSPHIANVFPVWQKSNSDYLYAMLATDADLDSLSYSPSVPLKDAGHEVDSFYVPATVIDDIIQSQMFVTPVTGDIIWQNASGEGTYQYAVRIDEWRRQNNNLVKIGYVIFDFQIYVLETDKILPQIAGIRDTAFVAGTFPEIDFNVSGGNNDSIRLSLTAGIPLPAQAYTSLPDSIYNSIPVNGIIYIKGTDLTRRYYPYKIVLSASGTGTDFPRANHNLYTWFTQNSSSPLPPTNLRAELLSDNLMRLSWNDPAGDEAGFIVERSDTYNPGFIRIAALPGNTVSYNDASILGERIYSYRIKAIGTEFSATSEILEVNSSGIISGMESQGDLPGIILYPNPAKNFISVRFRGINPGLIRINVLDITGHVRKTSLVRIHDDEDPIEIDIDFLEKGYYIITAAHSGVYYVARFIKN
ncbi:MAG TPA: T9SS type A sorting domain-containing protein [Cyclobacteriaceae bacterium]|nr:T9SS type A sorting domain-containing protein [Cyclobacteriaceae bacterium]